MRLRGWSRKRRLAVLVFVLAGLCSGAYAFCRQNVVVTDPDGTTRTCEWYCIVPPNGVITSGCT